MDEDEASSIQDPANQEPNSSKEDQNEVFLPEDEQTSDNESGSNNFGLKRRLEAE